MSKISDLKYYMQSLYSSFDDIEDIELRNRITDEFDKVESTIDDIETDLNSVKYELGEIL